MATNRLKAITLQTFDTSTLGAAYQAMGAGIEAACGWINLANDSDNAITVSFDGTNDHLLVRPNESMALPLQNTKEPQNEASKLDKGTIVYVKSSTASAGTFGFMGLYNL